MTKKYKPKFPFIQTTTLLILLLLIYNITCTIYITFKILENDNYNKFFSSSHMIKYWKEPKIFSELIIGNPPQKIRVIFNTKNYELNLFQNMCDIQNSFYKKELSSTYKYIKSIGYNYYFNNQLNCSIISETIYLPIDQHQNNKISIENFNIIYSENKEEEFKKNYFNKKEYEYHLYTCINIGFQSQQSVGFGYNINFVSQLKSYKKNNISLINGYDWSFKFITDNSGYLIIGEKPHEFDKNNYKKEQLLFSGAKNRHYISDWYLEFNSIYYAGVRENNNSLYNSSFYHDSSVKFDLNLGLIEGNNFYENNIKNDFFSPLINKSICFSEEVDEYRIYYCDKKQSINYIEKYFPILKFCMKQYGMCFEFDYKDLFREKNSILYFLVIFKSKEKKVYRFTIGQMLLKKYLITFNYDSKMIGFYNKNIKYEEKENEKTEIYYEYDAKIIIILIIAFIILLIIGILLGKKIYEKTRKKKVNELNDDYEYESHDINSYRSHKSLTLEMSSKYGEIE